MLCPQTYTGIISKDDNPIVVSSSVNTPVDITNITPRHKPTIIASSVPSTFVSNSSYYKGSIPKDEAINIINTWIDTFEGDNITNVKPINLIKNLIDQDN